MVKENKFAAISSQKVKRRNKMFRPSWQALALRRVVKWRMICRRWAFRNSGESMVILERNIRKSGALTFVIVTESNTLARRRSFC